MSLPITLDYLINEQDGIGEQGGKFSKNFKRAGWNKRAEGAKKFASINKQGGNLSCFYLQMKISSSFLLLCNGKVTRYLMGTVLVNNKQISREKEYLCRKKKEKARWNKRAGRAKYQISINEQGENQSSRGGKFFKINKQGCSFIR